MANKRLITAEEYDLYTYPNQNAFVKRCIVDKFRWEHLVEYIFHLDDKYWRLLIREPATENQEFLGFDYGDVYMTEVEPREVTTIEWVEV